MSLLLIWPTRLWAEDINVKTLSEGACWYEEGNFLKVASFNDRESLFISRDSIESQVTSLLSQVSKEKSAPSDLALHCGGYGASLVIKTVVDHGPACLWVKFSNGRLQLRSLGGLEDAVGSVCDGYKWGELIVGVKSLEQLAILESDHFASMIKTVNMISETVLKIELFPKFYGKELSVMEELKGEMDFRYIELNHFQHAVGEFAIIK